MSGSEVEIYTTHAQLWPWETTGKKPQTTQNNIKKYLTKNHTDFFFLTENNISYLAQLSTLRCVCFSQLHAESLVAFRGRSLHCGGIKRNSFSVHGLNSQQICQELGEDREARQVWGVALEAASWIHSSWRNPVFPHMAHVRVENVFAITAPV